MNRDTHILKIVNNGRTFRNDIGITCYPHQTYGVSQDSPDHFKRPFSMMAKNGYIYRYDEEEQKADPEQILSQKKYFSVVGNGICQVQEFPHVYKDSVNKQQTVFRRKKGRLTQFMDKNGWKNKVYKIMGDERTERARQASNRDRKKRIQSLKLKNKYQNPVAVKPLPKQNQSIQLMYTTKAKIRGQRFSFKNKNNQSLQIQRTIQTPRDRYIEAQSMTNKLGRTMVDKDWKQTMNTIRKKSNQKPIDQFSLSMSDWKNNYKTVQVGHQIEKDQLKQWFNSTCNSSNNPWKYRKPKKIDTRSSQQCIQMDD